MYWKDLRFLYRKMTILNVDVEVKKLSNGGMTMFDLAPPVFPGRLVVLTLELVDAGTTHITFSGDTKPFMNGFWKMQIKANSIQLSEADDLGEYFPASTRT